jgi:hypothetical protein
MIFEKKRELSRINDEGCITSKLTTYFDFKQNFNVEKYFFLNFEQRKVISKY